MKKFAFISKYVPNERQIILAVEKGIELIHVGERDAFTCERGEFAHYDGVVVMHPAAALRLLHANNTIGVFENASYYGSFVPIKLHLFDAKTIWLWPKTTF
jgi:hypothetical protein